jgi:hypothetical protein
MGEDDLRPVGRVGSQSAAVHPIGWGGAEVGIAFQKTGSRLLEQERLILASFVRLIGAQGLPESSLSDL